MKKQRKYSENLTGQAGQTTSEIGNSLAGPGRRRVGLESHRPGRAWARDIENPNRWAGLGQARSAPPGSTTLPTHPQKPLDLKYWIFYNLKISRNVTQKVTYQLFSLGMECHES